VRALEQRDRLLLDRVCIREVLPQLLRHVVRIQVAQRRLDPMSKRLSSRSSVVISCDVPAARRVKSCA
jgi:hypothetical protein